MARVMARPSLVAAVAAMLLGVAMAGMSDCIENCRPGGPGPLGRRPGGGRDLQIDQDCVNTCMRLAADPPGQIAKCDDTYASRASQECAAECTTAQLNSCELRGECDPDPECQSRCLDTHSPTRSATCGDTMLDDGGSGKFDCSNEPLLLHACPTYVICADRRPGGCTAEECCTVEPPDMFFSAHANGGLPFFAKIIIGGTLILLGVVFFGYYTGRIDVDKLGSQATTAVVGALPIPMPNQNQAGPELEEGNGSDSDSDSDNGAAGGGGGEGKSSSDSDDSDTAAIPAGCARALYDYEPRDDDELALREGDIVQVTKVEDEWTTGLLNGKTGMFPTNYVEMAAAPGDRAGALMPTEEV